MKTIAIDFDGVIHKYSRGWQDGRIYDPPVDGTKEALERLMGHGFEIVIYSTRCYDRTINGNFEKNQVIDMEDWLSLHEISYTRIHTEPCKPLCVLFIDDNAYRFEGKWKDNFMMILKLLDKW